MSRAALAEVRQPALATFSLSLWERVPKAGEGCLGVQGLSIRRVDDAFFIHREYQRVYLVDG